MPYVIEMHFANGASLCSYGETEAIAWTIARLQVAGASSVWGPRMLRRMTGRPVSDEMASEIAEMLDAEIIGWTDVQRNTP